MAIAVACPALTANGESYRIQAVQIAQLLSSNQVSGDYRFTLPDVVSAVENPLLRVASRSRRENMVRMRVECVDHSQCLPFFVGLRFGSIEQARQFVAQNAPRFPSPTRRAVAPLVHRGSVAKLEVVSNDIKLFLYVRCLQSGVAGDWVHARDEESHKVYQAQVTGKDQLRLEL